MDLCTNLSYSRSLWPGKGYFYYLDKEGNKQALSTDKTYLRSSKSGFFEAFGSDNVAKNISTHELATSNIQYVEECYTPPFVNEIYCQFSLRIKANSLCPDVCNDPYIKNTLIQLSSLYAKNGGYKELAYRYAKNILMGTWLWRNQDCRGFSITVHLANNKSLVVLDAHKLDWYLKWKKTDHDSLILLTDFIANALADKKLFGYIDVVAKLSVGGGDEIIPSQEFLQDAKGKGTQRRFSKTIFENHIETVAFHSQKIGAALQIIDDWWFEQNDEKRLRVNEYGSDRSDAVARRHPTMNNDFYSLIKRTEEWISHIENDDEITSDIHFIMAVLVKGGLFNKSSSKK
ncbi:type I-F CRISPR-associated protein Csy3 [Photobacterium leiognathi]|uniref:type I-F CRISPR-associated protein Csy3 n=1 Tax=Photobacterium leiognathi TaxID=553611 RepID=UPI00076AA7D6|nr:type I-F CRISPR-associated protein Csy3 [Photobacterium leiognathi]